MSDQALLRDLCSICNTSKSKYRCPGCAARTCSLPCYKRHQQWAQCSGQRDATKFIKKSQLVTPAGVDHDFNFLTGIERHLERAERTVSATAAGAPSETQSRSRSQRGATQYAQLEALSGVTIIRAPKGLSRQKENRSHPSSTKKSKPNVVWTVEWLNQARDRVLTDTSSTWTLAFAQPFDLYKCKKRKLNAQDVASPVNSTTLENAATTSTNQNSPIKPVEQDVNIDKEQQQQQQPGPPPSRPRTSATSTKWSTSQRTRGEAHMADTHPRDARHDEPPAQPLGDEHHGFYLLRPRASSSRRVLVPLAPSTTLSDVLHGRTVLEFPTIYVFPSAMAQLPDEFILEDEYVKQEGEEQRELDELLRDLDPEILRRLKEDGERGEERREEEVDSKKILDVLKQDLGAGF